MDAHKNFAVSTVATAPSPATSGTSLTVASGDGTLFPTAPFNATVWPAGVQPTAANAEIVRVTARATDTLTIARAQEGTSARSIVVGDQIAATITAKTLTDVEAPIADGWIDDSGETWTWVSATSFKVSGLDVTAKYAVGTRIKLTQTTVKYFVVTASSFSTDTTVTITGGTDYTLANAAISANFHSYADCPQGYPTWFAYAPTYGGFSSNPPSSFVKFKIDGRAVTLVVATGNGTSNATTFTMVAPVAPAAPTAVRAQVANNGIDQATSGMAFLTTGGTTINVYRDGTFGGTAWTNSGIKNASFLMVYPI